jgi:hypothetical protein
MGYSVVPPKRRERSRVRDRLNSAFVNRMAPFYLVPYPRAMQLPFVVGSNYEVRGFDEY